MKAPLIRNAALVARCVRRSLRSILHVGVLLLVPQIIEAQAPLEPNFTSVDQLHPPNVLDMIGVTQLRHLDSELNGTGVRVAHPESAVAGPAGQYQVNPSVVGQPESLFTWIGDTGQTANEFPNNVGTQGEHANLTGRTFYGRTNLEGVAYGVSHVDNFHATRFLDFHIDRGNSIAAKVVTQSFHTQYSNCPECNVTTNQRYDDFVAAWGTLIASAVGNGKQFEMLHGVAYNEIGVGAFSVTGVAPIYSGIGPALDGRSKPDITAPALSTSYSTPLFAGATAVLAQAANSTLDTGDNDPRTLKALLLNGAIKPLFTPNPAYAWIRPSEAQPLDRRHGAGIVNVFNSYKQLQAGRRTPDSGVGAQSGWDLRAITHENPVRTYSFTLTGTGLYNGTATLVWHRREGETSINDLNLSLMKDGAPIAASVSQVDNVEHLFVQRLEPGTYDLKVERLDNVVEDPEDYAIAFNFTPVQLIRAVSRKTHGDAGAIDIELPLTGSPGVECRSGTHQVILTFAGPVKLLPSATSSGSKRAAFFWTDIDASGNATHQTGTPTVSGDGTDTITLDLVGAPNARTITVALFGIRDGVNDGDGTHMSDVGFRMGVLLGDTNGDRAVNSGDALQTRNRSGQVTNAGNFRSDVNLDGVINSGDALVVRNNSGQGLP